MRLDSIGHVLVRLVHVRMHKFLLLILLWVNHAHAHTHLLLRGVLGGSCWHTHRWDINDLLRLSGHWGGSDTLELEKELLGLALVRLERGLHLLLHLLLLKRLLHELSCWLLKLMRH